MQSRNGEMMPTLDERAMRLWHETEEMPDVQARKGKLLRSLTSCLSKRQRRVVRMHYGILARHEMPHDEIAAALGISTAEVDHIFIQGLQELKRFSQEFGNWVESERLAASIGPKVLSKTRH